MPRKKPIPQPYHDLLSLADVAQMLERPKASVLRVARRIDVGRQVGAVWIYTAADAKRIGASFKAGPGNPNMVAGNKVWKGKKKAKKAKKA